VAKQVILETDEVATLVRLIEEATRSTAEGVRRFVEPASGTLVRATSRQHHLVFGRRGSGKSSLLRKAAADLTVDRRPIAFVDLESFKGHAYPDVLLSVLVETFSKFAEWLETAAIAPANKASFWSRLFGKTPTRPAFDKAKAKSLATDLRASVSELRNLLFREDEVTVEEKKTIKATENEGAKDEIGVGAGGMKLGLTDESGSTREAGMSIRRSTRRPSSNICNDTFLIIRPSSVEWRNSPAGMHFYFSTISTTSVAGTRHR
jgi:hypothetical protein